MNKLGNLNEFIGVGNIPFTVNGGVSSNSKKIGNDFIQLMNQCNQACYILPAKFDSKTFRNELIMNPELKKIVLHKNSPFDIAADFLTCHVVLNNNDSDTFMYISNTNSDTICLKKCTSLAISNDILTSQYIKSERMTFGDIWNRGKKTTTSTIKENQISGIGKYKVITKVGKNDGTGFTFTYDDTEDTLIGKWKVIISNVSGGTAVKIASPDYSISYSIIGFEVDTKETALYLKEYLDSKEIIKIWKGFKRSNANTKSVFLKIPLPDAII